MNQTDQPIDAGDGHLYIEDSTKIVILELQALLEALYLKTARISQGS